MRELLSSSRLLTLTGVGGTGKTRLALKVSRQVVRTVSDGVWWAALAEVKDPQLLEFTVAQAVGLQSPKTDALNALIEYLRPKDLLLVLDNCEHLLESCANLVYKLLQSCPHVRVLATSREALGIIGEQVFAVPSLPVPDGPNLFKKSGTRHDAIDLFAKRASEAFPGFSVTDDNLNAVADLCRRLDGLPLAIELAAVRVRVLSVEEILQRLDNRFRMLATGNRAGPARHRTLRAAFDWSFDLCDEQQRAMWARLSVFAGSASLGAVEEVCAGDGVDREEVVEAIAGLVSKSIVIREEVDGQTRFRLLEAVREYGLDKLRERGEEAQLRCRHRDYYRHVAERFETEWFGPDQLKLFALMRVEHPNLRAAMDFSLAEQDPTCAGIRMAASLWLYWFACGFQREGRHWLDRALTVNTKPSRERAAALWADGYLTLLVGEARITIELLKEARVLAQRLGDSAILAHSTYVAGLAELAVNNPVHGTALLENGLELERAQDDPLPHLPLALLDRGYAACLTGDLDQAAALLSESQSICNAHGESWMHAWDLVILGLTQWRQGNEQSAIRTIRKGLRRKHALNDLLGVALSVEFLAWCFVTSRSDYTRAARLFGAGQKLWDPLGAFLIGFDNLLIWHEQCEGQARTSLGDTAFTEAQEIGRKFSVERAVRYALGTEGDGPEATDISPPDAQRLLTRREVQVADMLSRGMSNKEIAKALVISQRTAEGHVENILTKLGFTSRSQVAVWLAEQKRATGSSSGKSE